MRAATKLSRPLGRPRYRGANLLPGGNMCETQLLPMVLLGSSRCTVGDLPGFMASSEFKGINLSELSVTAAARWRHRARGVNKSSALAKPRVRRWRQLTLPWAPASGFSWPDDVLRYVWDLVRQHVHAKLKARWFASIHSTIRSRTMVSVSGTRDELVGQDLYGGFGFHVYCSGCGGRRRIQSVHNRLDWAQGINEYLETVTLHTACEECQRPQEFSWVL